MVGRGWTQPGGRPHAEALALSQAGERAAGATAYVTLEPCAHRSDRGTACADALIASGVARVVVGVRDPDPRTAGQGIERLRASGVDASCLDHALSRRSLIGYLIRTALGRPHVTLKIALSLDGCSALADGTSRWITGPQARAHVHSRRAMSDAILVGGDTWRLDSPRLDVRLPVLENRSPERWVLTCQSVEGARTISSPEAISDMGEAQYLYVEGGAQTAASFLAADLVDRLELYRAPIVIGGGREAVRDIGLLKLAEAHDQWRMSERRQLGSDEFTAYERQRCLPA